MAKKRFVGVGAGGGGDAVGGGGDAEGGRPERPGIFGESEKEREPEDDGTDAAPERIGHEVETKCRNADGAKRGRGDDETSQGDERGAEADFADLGFPAKGEPCAPES